ncbi:glycerol-3-phosphate 1-O-acyltransferase PlsY [Rhodoplanes sp. TEM]|uniref:Glycerol-3-phosphate acyltransferase n=1 Tax=Rhodoplanes tepidamans TaxID=200616 RepID=A0ABT5J6P0_RHOTP|nr:MULTISPECIES: glycerol-3-phosphate 1-O-acyltransferase PlsY [Rhodoplanes]MDC7785276.1 glycerol-3-phosphate 1-O-acyltransferase PlsY [Rhodoplanes tepidamans]MDC7984657.1 glycerol-3-phosphate 1-O-acyltransferase PlsY [Rhodoplanes sp. TEM]MDQ0353534.1 glycerol-3-phosphate acyltransferase PlsY [Rhodoplanes tepidamans]
MLSGSWFIALPVYAAALALGYLLGAIPFGLLLTRLAGEGDIRSIGSGNIGATNVLRTGRKGLAAATLLLDALKGTAAVLAAPLIATNAAPAGDLAVLAGLGAFLGHLFPVWLRFRGGKGVATFIGVLIAFSPLVAVGFGAVWLAAAFTTRYSSVGGLSASAATPLLLWLADQPKAATLFAVMAVITWIKHAPNLKRLAAGTESKIGRRSVGSPPVDDAS